MKERIRQIMAYKGLNSSGFAEETGIQRAAMSHILNGRNNVSLDVFRKILERFPDVNAEWLLFGKGEMILAEASPDAGKERLPDGDAGRIREPQPADTPLSSSKGERNPAGAVTAGTETVPKNVRKIIVFYSDGTFETFIPEKKNE